jgi:hypothetical protein
MLRGARSYAVPSVHTYETLKILVFKEMISFSLL